MARYSFYICKDIEGYKHSGGRDCTCQPYKTLNSQDETYAKLVKSFEKNYTSANGLMSHGATLIENGAV